MSAIRNVAVFGATGSVGNCALDVLTQYPSDFRVSVLAAHRDVEQLAGLCLRHRPDLAIIADAELESALVRRLQAVGASCDVASGPGAIIHAAASPLCDIAVDASAGSPMLAAPLAAVRAGKRVLLANRVPAITAGPLLTRALEAGDGVAVPLSPGAHALFEYLRGIRLDSVATAVRRLTLLSSGGPFVGRRRPALMTVAPDDILKHQTSGIEHKRLVDAATLMDTGLEAIAIHHLFRLPADRIDVQLRTRGAALARVQRADGPMQHLSGSGDIRTRLARGLTGATGLALENDLTEADASEPPDLETFRCLALALQVLRVGGDAAAILNAANDVAVEAFLAGSLPFLSIPDLIEQVLMELPAQPVVDIQTLSDRDRAARVAARRVLRNAC